ncbi:MAG TPA: phosphoribosylformylglycinamidine cyclo-ligase, partial [Candidatus Baltobacteraceae bacterium]|nr:phosphoribosylformylglycinamidine cyclo-ligase [Candidatus Baltobacteraceae bacterium]
SRPPTEPQVLIRQATPPVPASRIESLRPLTMKYADAGVNIAVADDAKQRIRHLASRTFTPAVLGGIGGFGALFSLDHKKYKEPVLVSSADGVGTKLKIAMAMGVHSTVGGDLVNHCVNDILVQGAEPLFFLDYLAMGKLEPNVVEQLVDGMSRACRKAGCALIGGETAEMPGFYPVGEYDLAGFIVGIVERKNILTGKNVKPGDTLLALPSAGLHTNGYSLARKLAFEIAKLKPDTYVAEVGNKIGAELLKPHLCYAPALKSLLAKGWISALAHITGGGIPGNLPRVLPSGIKAIIDLDAWPIPSIFKYLAKLGEIDTDELLQSFNMGVGMIVIVPADHVKEAEADLKRRREKFFRIGRIERGDTGKARLIYSGALNL